MLEFCGEDRCLVDSNGRVRLNQRIVNDFLRKCEGNVVMYVLPEGAVALYPEATYKEMRAREISDPDNVGSSFSARPSTAFSFRSALSADKTSITRLTRAILWGVSSPS